MYDEYVKPVNGHTSWRRSAILSITFQFIQDFMRFNLFVAQSYLLEYHNNRTFGSDDIPKIPNNAYKMSLRIYCFKLLLHSLQSNLKILSALSLQLHVEKYNLCIDCCKRLCSFLFCRK